MVVLVVALSKDWFRTVKFVTPLVAGLHEVLTLARFGSWLHYELQHSNRQRFWACTELEASSQI
jgi:hypothetical protein